MRRLPANVLKGLVRNPIIIALAAGVLYNLSGLPLPSVADTLTETLGRAALPCAVFAMGASLAGYRLAGSLGEASIGVILKLLLHPVLVRSEEHTYELQSLMRISYAGFCFKNKNKE